MVVDGANISDYTTCTCNKTCVIVNVECVFHPVFHVVVIIVHVSSIGSSVSIIVNVVTSSMSLSCINIESVSSDRSLVSLRCLHKCEQIL